MGSPNLLHEKLEVLAYQSLLKLVTDDGINASGKDDVYGCIFGRDSAITILKILNVLSRPYVNGPVDRQVLLAIVRLSLLKLTELQGTTINI